MTNPMIETSSTPRLLPRAARFAAVAAVALGTLGLLAAPSAPARAAGGEAALKHVDWSFNGPFGTYDRDALRRGYTVYKEVCATCHSASLLHFRNLADKGGPEFTEAEVKAIAAEHQVQDGPNAEGEMFDRPAEPKDRFPAPFPNDEAARAALGGALPPDLSVIAKARAGGADYLYSLLTGYEEPPAGVEVPAGLSYNTAFLGHQIAMPQPLADDQVEYDDGTPATLDQLSKDVTQFLMWAAEPKLEQRHRIGFMTMVYLVVLAGFLFFATRKVWADQH